jgi:two-component system NarL family sensor kinase
MLGPMTEPAQRSGASPGSAGRQSVVAIVAVTVIAFAIAVAASASRVLGPTTGTVVGFGGFVADGVTVEVVPGAVTPLRNGDLVTAVDDRSMEAWAASLIDPNRLSPDLAGGRVGVDLVRDGTALRLDVPLVPYPALAALAPAWSTVTFVVALLALGLLVFLRRPNVPSAGALLLIGVGASCSTFPFLMGTDPLDLATGSFVFFWVATGLVYLLLWAALLDFSLTFPQPFPILVRRPVLRLAPYAAILALYLVAIGVAALTSPGPIRWLGASLAVSLLPVIVTFATLPVLLVVRWRRGPRDDRKILRGVAYVTGFIVVTNVALWVVPEAIGAPRPLPPEVVGLTGIPFPLIVAASILRHRAFDIDVVLRRSLVYGGLTAAVIGIYAVTAAVLGATLGASTTSTFATSLLATGVAALAALPIRDGLQRGATRLLYGDRDDPVRAIRRLGDRLELSVDPDTMPRTVVDTVADALRLPYVGLELGLPPAARLVAERGTRPQAVIERPLAFQSRPIGRLLVAPRATEASLSPSDLDLLDDLTRQIGVAAHAAMLTEDLRASRERIVAAREEERRRLRRDLHDGLGPALAAIGLRAEAAATLLDDDAAADPTEARRLLGGLRSDVSNAVSDVRRLVEGLRPPALDELGLEGALRLAADRLSPASDPVVEVTALGELDDLPAAVEVAAFRIATEAMTNAVRHAAAAHCWVRLERGEDLRVTVEDDGRGLPVAAAETGGGGGVGMHSMNERAAELGGDCHVATRPGGGTIVTARLPLTARRTVGTAANEEPA